ncbi:MAG: hypothetical protein PW734_05650 [Verrucomicrobium sp.]|nr:hypothetical protein [Verrucomicrobium sp.]
MLALFSGRGEYSRAVLRRFGFTFAFLALFVLAGGHWAVLQSVAWARMVVEYSHEGGLERGVAQTFDGAHLCPLCMKVQQAKKAEEKAPADFADAKKKADSFPLSLDGVSPAVPGTAFAWPRGAAVAAAVRANRPPVPPPLSLFS